LWERIEKESEALHEAVLNVAEVADEGAKIGYEILGDEEFER